MTIGPDLAEILPEVGVSVSILHPATGVSVTEYIDFDINRQVTKPFIREFFIESTFAYNTAAASGDIVSFIVDGRKFLIMNLTGELFENAVISYNAVMYKCNAVITLKRPAKAGWNATYDRTITWTDLYVGVPVLLTERFFGTTMKILEPKDLLEYDILADQVYIPSYYDVKPLDRLWLSSTEYYKVDFVEKRKFDAVLACGLSEDTR
jgi:hypothetical protein